MAMEPYSSGDTQVEPHRTVNHFGHQGTIMGENTEAAPKTEEGEHQCDACGRTFDTREALVEHMCDQGQVG
jgi:hypothetical protein